MYHKNENKAKIKRTNLKKGGVAMSNLKIKGLWLPIEILTNKNLSDKEKTVFVLEKTVFSLH